MRKTFILSILLFAAVSLYAQEEEKYSVIKLVIAEDNNDLDYNSGSNNKVLTDRDFVYTSVVKPTEMVPLDKDAMLIYDKDGVINSFNLKKGKINWSVKADEKGVSSCGNKLTLHEGVVYVPFTNGQIYALDNRTGELFWKSRLGKNEGVILKNQFPVIHNNLLHIVAQNQNQNIYALDIKEGGNVWNYRLEYPYNHIPLLYFNEMIFVTSAPNIYSFQAKTGKLLRMKAYNRPMGRPVTDGERVIIPNQNQWVYAYNPQGLGYLWSFDLDDWKQHNIGEKVFCKDSNLYFAGTSMVYALNSKTGESKWKTDIKKDIRYLTENGKSIWGYTESGVLFELDYSGNKLREVELKHKPISNIEFLNKKTLYYYSNNGLVEYNLAKNKEKLIHASSSDIIKRSAYIKIVR